MRFPMSGNSRSYAETRVPGLELDADYTDYLVTTKSRTEMAALRVWLKGHGHPPLQHIRTPVLAPLWAHDAAVLAEFDRGFSTTSRNSESWSTVPTPDVHVLYRITPGSPSYHSFGDLPPLTHLELVRLPRRVRRSRRDSNALFSSHSARRSLPCAGGLRSTRHSAMIFSAVSAGRRSNR